MEICIRFALWRGGVLRLSALHALATRRLVIRWGTQSCQPLWYDLLHREPGYARTEPTPLISQRMVAKSSFHIVCLGWVLACCSFLGCILSSLKFISANFPTCTCELGKYEIQAQSVRIASANFPTCAAEDNEILDQTSKVRDLWLQIFPLASAKHNSEILAFWSFPNPINQEVIPPVLCCSNA